MRSSNLSPNYRLWLCSWVFSLSLDAHYGQGNHSGVILLKAWCCNMGFFVWTKESWLEAIFFWFLTHGMHDMECVIIAGRTSVEEGLLSLNFDLFFFFFWQLLENFVFWPREPFASHDHQIQQNWTEINQWSVLFKNAPITEDMGVLEAEDNIIKTPLSIRR